MSGLIMRLATTQRRATMSRIPRMSGTIGRRAATMRESGDLKPRRATTNLTPAMRLRVQPAPTAMIERFQGVDDRNIVPNAPLPFIPCPYRGRFFGKLLRGISRFRHQDAQTPSSPRVG